MLALPAAPLGAVLRPGPEPPRAWGEDARGPASPGAGSRPRTGTSPRASQLAFLRQVTGHRGQALRCRAGRVRGARRGTWRRRGRNRDYRRCATAPLARTRRVREAPTAACSPTSPARRTRPASAAGACSSCPAAAGALGFTSNTTLRGGLDAPWAELLVCLALDPRAGGRDAAAARAQPGWAATCKAAARRCRRAAGGPALAGLIERPADEPVSRPRSARRRHRGRGTSVVTAITARSSAPLSPAAWRPTAAAEMLIPCSPKLGAYAPDHARGRRE